MMRQAGEDRLAEEVYSNLRSNLPIVWLYQNILNKEVLEDHERYCLGYCPIVHHRHNAVEDKVDLKPEIVLYTDTNTYVCHGNKCHSREYRPIGDVIDLYIKSQRTTKTKARCINELLEIVKLVPEEAKAKFNSDIPKWIKTKANWGTRHHLPSAKQKNIRGSSEKLQGILQEYEALDSPFDLKSMRREELAFHIHCCMWEPKELRCLQTTQKMFPPLITTQKGLSDYIEVREWTLFNLTYMTGCTYKRPAPPENYGIALDREEYGLRRDNNVKDRCYLCVEMDDDVAKLDQLKVHAYLSTLQPLVVIVDSGGKSMHGYYNVRRLSIGEINKFWEEAVLLFACTPTMQPNHLCRLPFGVRKWDKQNRLLPKHRWKLQTVKYFNEQNARIR